MLRLLQVCRHNYQDQAQADYGKKTKSEFKKILIEIPHVQILAKQKTRPRRVFCESL
jgi:hypothetical protein